MSSALSGAPTGPSRQAARALFDIKGFTKIYQSGEVTIHAQRGVDAVLNEGELAVMPPMLAATKSPSR